MVEIRAGGLEWELVESIPVSESIKTMTGDWKAHVEAWKESLRQLAKAGISTVCYNFMPVLDWTRTDLRWEDPGDARTMRFELVDFVAFDIHVLQRPGATGDYPAHLIEAARERFDGMPQTKVAALSRNIGAGLPGSSDGYSIAELRAALSRYDGI
ncbi:MAG: mannonate dehydratase, partial [Mesorhizobium sp.]|nr:mannonate dehydratase [Mesorhizobium sp.]